MHLKTALRVAVAAADRVQMHMDQVQEVPQFMDSQAAVLAMVSVEGAAVQAQ
jgi:hypothetical protein